MLKLGIQMATQANPRMLHLPSLVREVTLFCSVLQFFLNMHLTQDHRMEHIKQWLQNKTGVCGSLTLLYLYFTSRWNKQKPQALES